MTDAERRRIVAESRARALAASKLAQDGKYQCRFCRKEKSLSEGIVTMWGGTVLFALCPECYPGRPIIMDRREDSQGNPAVYVGFLKESDRPADLLVVPTIASAREIAAAPGLAKPKKLDFGEE